tara:strand:- start:10553 stop:11443 length:891 start_codon:yes stop_codon:yes gene_type:complete
MRKYLKTALKKNNHRICSKVVSSRDPSIAVTLEITHLGSGSRGNSVLLSTPESKVMIDCGFSLKKIESKLDKMDVNPHDIDTILVTHHHSDHSKSAFRASKKWGCNLISNAETARRLEWGGVSRLKIFSELERIEAGVDISLLPVPVPHDDAENVAVIACGKNGKRAAVVTDLGEVTTELISHLKKCDHISIEANYDHDRLMRGGYPDSLKRRVSGRGGHLSNYQTAKALQEIVHPGLRSIVLCHLSESNNLPHIAESEVLMGICESFNGSLRISKQDGPEFSNYIGQSDPQRIVA